MPFNVDVIREYKSKYFIETGTCGGLGIINAIGLGFENIRSVELDERLYEEAKNRVGMHEHVKLYLGDSREKLWEMIEDIDEQCTFWLDAHGPQDPDLREEYGRQPIMEELEAIKKHPVKNHTIIIDDREVFGDAGFDYVTEEEVKEKILEINKDYKFKIDGVKDELLIAYV